MVLPGYDSLQPFTNHVLQRTNGFSSQNMQVCFFARDITTVIAVPFKRSNKMKGSMKKPLKS